MDLNSRKNSTYIILGVGVIFVALILFQYYSLKNPSTYLRKLDVERSQKNLQFQNAPESPLTQEQKSDFPGLVYFAPDENYRCEATLIKDGVQDTLLLLTSTGEKQQFIRAGKLEFALQGQSHQLVAFRYVGERENTYFIPFTDLTSGVSSYGGGRYMDISTIAPLYIDFNRAYHPYCVYNETYSCPIPPRENRLNLEIRAGEKLLKS